MKDSLTNSSEWFGQTSRRRPDLRRHTEKKSERCFSRVLSALSGVEELEGSPWLRYNQIRVTINSAR